MSYLPITILAYLLNSIAVTIDKFLLVRRIPNPLTYVFYISVFSLLVLLALPYTLIPKPYTLFLASISTLLWNLGAYLMFKAIQKEQVSRVVPVIGTLIPLLLLIHAAVFGTLTQNQLVAVVVLIIGLVFLTSGALHLEGVKLEILSAFFFAVSYLVLRQAYLEANFLTVLVYSRFILIPLAVLILLIPNLRKIVLTSIKPRTIAVQGGGLFLFGQALGGIQQLLLTFSISLATPALVNSLQGIQYVFLFLFSLILSKKYPAVFEEKWSVLILLSKILGIGLIGIGLYLLST